jgi:hypothetical protein
MENNAFKKILVLLFVIIVGNFSIFSQTVNGKLLTEIDTHYLQVTFNYAELFNSMLNVKIDYGQDSKLRKNTFLLDESGKQMEFYSFVDASNFLYKNGFEYVDVKTIRNENVNQDTYLYTFKKRTNK